MLSGHRGCGYIKVVLPISFGDHVLDKRNCCIKWHVASKGLLVLSIMEYVELQPAYVVLVNTNLRRDLDCDVLR